MFGNKKIILSQKTAPTNPIQTALFWFGLYFKSQPNRTHFILRFGWLLVSKPNQPAPRTPLATLELKKEADWSYCSHRTQNHNHRRRNKWTTILMFGNVAKKHIEATVHMKEIWKFFLSCWCSMSMQNKWKGREDEPILGLTCWHWC